MSPLRTSCSDGLARLVLASPPLNILTMAVLKWMREELDRLATDMSVRALLLSADGAHFSAGADVREHLAPDYQSMIPEFLGTIDALNAFPVPVIAAVQGRCLGGAFELVLPADIIIAGESAQFGQPEIVLGVTAPAACAWLPAMAPRGVVASLLFTGDPIGAREAERVGLVRQVVPDGELERAALAVAGRITRHSAVALRMTKHMMRATQGLGRSAGLEVVERLYCDDLMASADATEGLTAFVEKRQPIWSHR